MSDRMERARALHGAILRHRNPQHEGRMMGYLDWSKPLEAVHEDGRVVAVALVETDARDYDYNRHISPKLENEFYWFRDDGSHVGCKWRIRNVVSYQSPPPEYETPINRELWERVCRLVQLCAGLSHSIPSIGSTAVDEAREIAKLLPKPAIDPDLLEARKIAAAPFDLGIRQEYLDGKNDHLTRVKELLSTLKRGREMERGE